MAVFVIYFFPYRYMYNVNNLANLFCIFLYFTFYINKICFSLHTYCNSANVTIFIYDCFHKKLNRFICKHHFFSRHGTCIIVKIIVLFRFYWRNIYNIIFFLDNFLERKGLLIKLLVDFINERELYFSICFLLMIAWSINITMFKKNWYEVSIT